MEEKKIAKRKNVSELSRIIFGLGKEVSRTEWKETTNNSERTAGVKISKEYNTTSKSKESSTIFMGALFDRDKSIKPFKNIYDLLVTI